VGFSRIEDSRFSATWSADLVSVGLAVEDFINERSTRISRSSRSTRSLIRQP
jgi:hypothetical protein